MAGRAPTLAHEQRLALDGGTRHGAAVAGLMGDPMARSGYPCREDAASAFTMASGVASLPNTAWNWLR